MLNTQGVTAYEDNAYRMMTTLSYLLDSNDKGISTVEKQLFRYLQGCIDKKSGREKLEGSVMNTTLVLTSLGLL